MIEVTYEVYRFRKWWKNSFEIYVPLSFYINFTEEEKISHLSKEAFRRDMWEIRDLSFKGFENEK